MYTGAEFHSQAYLFIGDPSASRLHAKARGQRAQRFVCAGEDESKRQARARREAANDQDNILMNFAWVSCACSYTARKPERTSAWCAGQNSESLPSENPDALFRRISNVWTLFMCMIFGPFSYSYACLRGLDCALQQTRSWNKFEVSLTHTSASCQHICSWVHARALTSIFKDLQEVVRG